jgi:hypothetical protein
MKIDVQESLVKDAVIQLAAQRDLFRDKNNNTVEWDRTSLGQLYSVLSIALHKRSLTSTAKDHALSNRRKVSSRFSR